MSSPTLSIIIGFKDRELARVQTCLANLALQTSSDFEVLLIDYGSREGLHQELKKACAPYSFVRLVHNQTRGMVWNRSHALNTGARQATGQWLLFSDVDLIYHPEYVRHLLDLAREDAVVFNRIHLLPEGYWPQASSWETVRVNTTLTTPSARGIFMLSAKEYAAIGGLDEYYAIWGGEDNDFGKRIEQKNLSEVWADYEQYPVYHIWHPDASHLVAGLMPERWMEDMIWYYLTHLEQVNRNANDWGHCWKEAERPSLLAAEKGVRADKQYHVPEKGYAETRSLAFRTIYFELRALAPNQVLEIIVPKWQPPTLSPIHNRIVTTFKNILHKFNSPYQLQSIEWIEKHKYFTPEVDMRHFIWRLITQKKEVQEYYIQESAENIRYFLTKK